MDGFAAGLMSAFFYAVSMVCGRRGVLRIEDAALGGYIAIFVAPPLLLLAAALSGDLHSITAFAGIGYLWLAIAGIIHFVIGRTAHYWALRYLGANVTSVFTALQLVYTALLGFLILGERITTNILLGSALIIIGPLSLVWPQQEAGTRAGVQSGDKPKLSRKGIIAALLSGLFFGISPLFIKWGLLQGDSALAGSFISHSSAMLLFGITMLGRERRNEIVKMERQALIWFTWSGIFVGLATLCRFIAFKYSQISIAGPLTATSPVFLMLLSLIINRRVESFGLNVILGIIMVVAGAALLYR